MGTKNKQKIIPILGLLIFLSSCEYTDIKDMFISEISVNERFDNSMNWNSSHPFQELITPTEDYLIMNMADSHVGTTKNLCAFINNAINKNALAMVINGDFTTGHSSDYNTFNAILPPQDTIKSFLTPGNHELYFDGWNEYYKRYGSSTYYFTVKTPTQRDLYICLDSGNGTLGSKQLAWLENVLKNNRQAYRNCVIFTHVNLFRIRHTGSTNPNMEELYILLDLYAKHHVNMLITGHDHIRYEEKLGNTIHLSVDALKDGLTNSGYLELQINNTAIHYTFVAI